ncbi:MAG TPA: hypothetical protein VF096_06785 [Azonexus sp.]
MKNSPNLKSGLRLLLLAGVMTPLVAIGEASAVAAMEKDYPVWSYEEGATTQNLQRIQMYKPIHDDMRGAQGPVRTDFSEHSLWSYEEGATTQNLQRIQSSKSMGAMSSSEGPSRAEFAEQPTWE